jgi:single-strand DNA-binding protein
MKYINKATLVGRVGNVDHRANNVVSLTLATHEYSKDQGGKYQPKEPQWHRVVCFDKISDAIKHYGVAKGSRIMVEGKIKTKSYEQKNDKGELETKVTTQIYCNYLEKLVSEKAEGDKNG